MLRVGLTGGLGSGKSTAARLFAAHGAHVLQSDAIGRELMEPGQAVYAAIVDCFGRSVVSPGGRLDRAALAKIAFSDGRVDELNAIVHPAVIARQAELAEAIGAGDPHAIVIVESALIFETKYSETKYGETGHDTSENLSKRPWHSRFDRIILVTAPEEVKIARFVARSGASTPLTEQRRTELEAEARRRLAQQLSDEQKSAFCDYVLTNGGPLQELEWQVDRLWPILQAAAK
ncbi:MAG: dephospho-CoA kinase [Edaphobacter sp.]